MRYSHIQNKEFKSEDCSFIVSIFFSEQQKKITVGVDSFGIWNDDDWSFTLHEYYGRYIGFLQGKYDKIMTIDEKWLTPNDHINM